MQKLARLLILIFLAVSIFTVLSERKKTLEQLVDPSFTKINLSLANIVENSLKDTTGTYGVAIKNFKTGESYYLNENKLFETGSLYKLWIMAAVYNQIQNGSLTADEILSEDITTLNEQFNIDPDLAELSNGTITMTVQNALNQMITISHNYAALLLTEKIKLSSVAKFLKTSGFNESSVGTDGNDPKSTVSDILLFYEKLYAGELASEENTQKMISLLKNQQLNDGLTKYLPNGTQIAHKTGDIGWYKHDAGIVFSEKGDYIIIVMSESDFPAGAQEKIALLSKAVYDYFEK